MLAMLGMQSDSTIRCLSDRIGVNPDTMWLGRSMASGESRFFHLPIQSFWMTGLHLDNTIDTGAVLEFRFFPMGDIRSSGTGVVSLDDVMLIMDSDIQLPEDTKVMTLYNQ